MKVGLYFGSFNPIHFGHLIIAERALAETPLDRIWFVVSPQNPFKKKKNLLSEYDRFRMVEMAIEENHNFLASNVEMKLPKPSYTIDTLAHLQDKYRSYEFALIMGGDNLQHFHKWKSFQTILDCHKIYVYPRPGSKESQFDKHPSVTEFKAPLLDISATYIRNALRNNKSIRYLTPEKVRTYIQKGRLYQ